MEYKKFTIKNYKGIGNVNLSLSQADSGVHTLVGLNESGKTTVLEAISGFTYGAEDLSPLQHGGYKPPDPDDFVPISKRANFNGKTTIAATIEMSTEDKQYISSIAKKEYDFTITSISSEIVVTDSYTFVGSKYDPEGQTRLWSIDVEGTQGNQRKPRKVSGDSPLWHSIVKHLSSRMPKIWYFPNFLFDFPDKIYLSEERKFNQGEGLRNTFYRSLLQDILDSLDNETCVKEHLLDRAVSDDDTDRRSLDSLRLEMSRSVSRRVFDAWQSMFRQSLQDKEIDIAIDQDADDEWYAQFRIRDADGYSSLSDRSLGFRWFFVYLLLTTYRTLASKSNSGKMLLLLDEPASNLHSTAQAQLRKSFESLSDMCYIIYTTHSHHLIEPRWLGSTYVVRNAGIDYCGPSSDFDAKKTDIQIDLYHRFVNNNPSLTTYYQPILDMLDYQPSSLENVNGAILVEGKSDYYALCLAEIELDRKTPLLFTPLCGSSGADCVISLYLGWGKDFVLLLDSDKEGEAQKRRYLEKFGPIVNGHIYTYKDICSELSNSAVESMFDKKDLLAMCRYVDPSVSEYTKKLLHIAIQEHVAAGRPYGLSDASKLSFKKVLEFLDDVF